MADPVFFTSYARIDDEKEELRAVIGELEYAVKSELGQHIEIFFDNCRYSSKARIRAMCLPSSSPTPSAQSAAAVARSSPKTSTGWPRTSGTS